LREVRSSALVLQPASEGRNAMPSFAATLTPEQIRDVAAYVTQKLAAPPSK
jgi:mono/diheme cytochrome c family protein